MLFAALLEACVLVLAMLEYTSGSLVSVRGSTSCGWRLRYCLFVCTISFIILAALYFGGLGEVF